jgi:hypothetical protein
MHWPSFDPFLFLYLNTLFKAVNGDLPSVMPVRLMRTSEDCGSSNRSNTSIDGTDQVRL